MKRLTFLLGTLGFVVFGSAFPAAAQDPGTSREIQDAIDRGVAYLKKAQKTEGSGNWQHSHYRGATPLAAWALVECGVSPNDPLIQKAADNTRQMAVSSDWTYDLTMAIMFLDRLGDPEDLPIIEGLALRILASQSATNGWVYKCKPLPEAIQARIKDHVDKMIAAGPRKLPEKLVEPKQRDPKDVDKAVMSEALAINRAPVLPPQMGSGDPTDNSNTQFALLALWVARRAGMPTDRALARGEVRFRAYQQKSGGWEYRPPPSGEPASATMTAAGLLSFALGYAVTPAGGSPRDAAKDEGLQKALVALSASIGKPGQPRDDLVLKDPVRSYYFLWTVERVAVIFGLKTLGGKDWYAWGTELLLANQHVDGSWQGEYVKGGVDTSFALLFLKKANIARDLTSKMENKVKDPGQVPAQLLDLIGREITPGVEMPKKNAPKKNLPLPEPPPPPPQRESQFDAPKPAKPTGAVTRATQTARARS
jgi:hypothetical protein